MNTLPSMRSYTFMFTAIIAWGLSTPFIEFGLLYITPFPFLAYRFIFAAVIITPYVIITRSKELGKMLKNKWVWAIGISESLGLILQYIAQSMGVTAGLAALLSLMFLVMVPFLSPLFLTEKIYKYHGFAIIVALVGIYYISFPSGINSQNNNSTPFIGVILLLGSALSYGLYIIFTSRYTTIENRDVDTFSLFYVVLVIISIFSSLTTITFDSFKPIQGELWIWLIGISLIPTIIAFFSYFEALKTIPANTSSVLLPMQLIVPFITDYFIVRRIYGFSTVLGILCIIVSMAIVVITPLITKLGDDNGTGT
ncbi:MAG: DMT family transporter [Candidatus Heimdallarchaeota archaeon]|nr:DMT family transporter [Candidatus Heimdallarchaeota archaeon]MDH5644984.1 DMT family transporter [Candidatus Heimdallarchaeota archaeon]